MLLSEGEWVEDLLDAALAKERMTEPERPVEMLLREHGLMQ